MFHGAIAYNADTGEKLWEPDAVGRGVTPISYMLDGKAPIPPPEITQA